MAKIERPNTITTHLYGVAQKLGLLNHPGSELVFRQLYFFYKKQVEDPFFLLCKRTRSIVQNGHIIDAGANVGYTTWVFAQFLSPGFQIFAFEPNKSNFIELTKTCENYRLQKKVTTVNAALGAKQGVADLWINFDHPADHRIVTPHFEALVSPDEQVDKVALTSIDEYIVQSKVQGAISFVKIDVQGYEQEVCLGMENTIAKNPDICVAFEYGPAQIRELGFLPERLLDHFRDRGFQMHLINRQGRLQEFSLPDIERLVAQQGYLNLLAAKGRLLC